MRKLARITGTALAALIGLVVGALVTGFEGLDDQPSIRSDYHARTVERLRDSTNRTLVARGALEAGFGKALLTPTLAADTDDPVRGRFASLPLAGYGVRRGRPASGVHDDLWAKAIAVRVAERTAVWVGADALIIPREVSHEVMRLLAKDPGLSREQVYFGATHTHASLGGWGEGVVAEAFAGPYQPGV
ncbi:MAG TPA: neutral/alkaline non-lysosomal ceramidase N-terminal domain-containing protein, partial [Candidatus Paceibacterota bacterium]|nr:neutral/alkaline non-lysosomal ceramidase N-terminal domain-containing protein [Candidatus Paceibacterota bacterium]